MKESKQKKEELKNKDNEIKIIEIKNTFRQKLKKIKQEAQSLYFLTKDERNPIVSELVSENLRISSVNLFRSTLQLGLGNVDNWNEAKVTDLSGLQRKNKLKRDKTMPNSYLDISDMVASEAMPLIHLSKRLIDQSKEILKSSRFLNESKTTIESSLFSTTFFTGIELNSLSEELQKTKRK